MHIPIYTCRALAEEHRGKERFGLIQAIPPFSYPDVLSPHFRPALYLQLRSHGVPGARAASPPQGLSPHPSQVPLAAAASALCGLTRGGQVSPHSDLQLWAWDPSWPQLSFSPPANLPEAPGASSCPFCSWARPAQPGPTRARTDVRNDDDIHCLCPKLLTLHRG